jgi:hypothetical protein
MEDHRSFKLSITKKKYNNTMSSSVHLDKKILLALLRGITQVKFFGDMTREAVKEQVFGQSQQQQYSTEGIIINNQPLTYSSC